MHRRPALSCLLAVFIAASSATSALAVEPHARPRIPGAHVRGASPRMTMLLQQAIERSPTFAALVDAIDKTDVIVHVEELDNLGPGIDGRLSFVYATDEVRYLRAQVRSRRGRVETMSTIGHELQHAVEVAAHASVRDEKAFAALYLRIGDRADVHRFDTAAAREAGTRVRREIAY